MRRHRAGYRKHEAGIRSLALALGLTLAMPALAAEGGAKIGQPPLLGTLSGAWWQWALSIPANANPLIGPTGERCGVGQHGPV